MVRFPARPRYFSLPYSVQTASEATQPRIQWAPGEFSYALKWPDRETDKSPAFRAEIMSVNLSALSAGDLYFPERFLALISVRD